MGGSIWDHDLWRDIYSIKDPEIQRAFIGLYRLILDMRNSDVLAEAVAAKVNAANAASEKKRRATEAFRLTAFQKIVATLVGATVLADSIRGLIFG